MLIISHGIMDQRVLGELRKGMDNVLLEMVHTNAGHSMQLTRDRTEKEISINELNK